jgi:hypothetical protein
MGAAVRRGMVFGSWLRIDHGRGPRGLHSAGGLCSLLRAMGYGEDAQVSAGVTDVAM